MNKVWDRIVGSDSADAQSVLKERCSSPKDVTDLLHVIQNWTSEIHNNGEETRCWKCVPMLAGYVKDWGQLEFLCRRILLRSSIQEIRPLLLVTMKSLMSNHSDNTDQKCGNILQQLLIEAEEDSGNVSLRLLVDAMSLVFPICLGVCRDMFLSTDFQDILTRNLNSSADDEHLVNGALRLLAVSCIDEAVRRFIAEHYLKTLQQSFKVEKYKVLTALVLIKIWSFTKIEKETLNSCINLFIDSLSNGENIEINTEALAYLTLKPSVRVLLRGNGDVCLKIIELIKSQDTTPTDLYGLLIILANVSEHPSQNEDTVDKLKASLKTNQEKNDEPTLENVKDIEEFNRDYIIDLDLIGSLKSIKLSTSSYNQAIRIIYNVTRDKTQISECVKQGAGLMLLVFLAQKRNLSKDEWYLLSIRALSKTLIYVNPETAFSKYSPLSAAPFLFENLPLPNDNALSELQFTQLDTYEALLALTNLATINQGVDLGKIILSNAQYWDSIENLLLDSSVRIQRSTLELISNLMSNPMAISAKFFCFENPKSAQNFEILVKLLELHDIQSQRAVAAIFANIASTVPFICKELSEKRNLIETAIRVFKTQNTDTDLRIRLLVLLSSIFNANAHAVACVKNDEEFVKELQKYRNTPSQKDPLTPELSKEILSLIN